MMEFPTKQAKKSQKFANFCRTISKIFVKCFGLAKIVRIRSVKFTRSSQLSNRKDFYFLASLQILFKIGIAVNQLEHT